jgi:hypothetical protein
VTAEPCPHCGQSLDEDRREEAQLVADIFERIEVLANMGAGLSRRWRRPGLRLVPSGGIWE